MCMKDTAEVVALGLRIANAVAKLVEPISQVFRDKREIIGR